LFFSPSAVADENPVRRAQRRSRMPGREATIPFPPLRSVPAIPLYSGVALEEKLLQGLPKTTTCRGEK